MTLSASRTLGEPTPEQRKRWEAMQAGGCVACGIWNESFTVPEIHHLTLGGKHGAPRLGHDYTIGLCEWHHRGINRFQMLGVGDLEMLRGPSYALTPKAFRHEFGGDKFLLDYQQDLLGLPRIQIPTRRPKATMTTVREQQEARGQSRNKAVRGKRRGSRCVTERALPRRYGG